jgi:hypothetical protein
MVVYAGVRTDGMLLVSIETLPQRAFPSDGRPQSVRGVFLAREHTIEPVATWEGTTDDAPQLFRIRPATTP